MKIKWLGHSCYHITLSNGIRILTDPFDETTGYTVPSVEADIVTSSHDHFDHNYVKCVRGEYKFLKTTDEYSENGVRIYGISTFHDSVGGKKRGSNIIFVYEIDGLRLCHCGDLGHLLSEEQLAEIGKVDILMIPVGGTYTINAVQANAVKEAIRPNIVIPMHYKTDWMNFPIEKVDAFLKIAGNSWKANRDEIEITAQNISGMPEIIVLDYNRA
ncbi:MAG: MBL fold metallo-hydrolase [Eubacteriales bacterium]|nr:MBL fold metallo-hydrolase [Eubacteriales bacterium]